MIQKADAKVVVLNKSDDHVPEFQRYAARLRARGRVVQPGDLLSVYTVNATVPEGPVTVTEDTEFIFSS